MLFWVLQWIFIEEIIFCLRFIVSGTLYSLFDKYQKSNKDKFSEEERKRVLLQIQTKKEDIFHGI